MTTDTHHHYQVILIDDDHEILKDLRLVVEADPGISATGIDLGGSYILDLVQTHHPDMVLMNVGMLKVDSTAVARQLKPRYPSLGVIMLTNFRHDTWLREALDTEADGFLIKDVPYVDLSAAIRHVAHGDRFVSTKPLNMLIASYKNPNFIPDPRFRAGREALTAIKRQVWQEALEGKSNAQVAKVMQSKESTIKTHMNAVMQELSVRSHTGLLAFNARDGAIHE